jgi:Cys-tRNA(Pro)/Cys-tRNA(Cys) deacylase
VAQTPAVTALERAGVTYTLHHYDHDPTSASYGLEAADALGMDPARVFKTLVATSGDQLIVGVVPVVTTLDLKSLARAAGVKRAKMADAADAERATGYVLGGISPLGQKRRLPTVVDDSAAAWPTVFCSGGRRGFEIELLPADLVRLTGAMVAPIGSGGGSRLD